MMMPLMKPQSAPTASTTTARQTTGLQRRADDQVRGQAVGQHEHHADREVDAGGQHRQRLRHRDDREQHALVGGGGQHRHRPAGLVLADVEREDHARTWPRRRTRRGVPAGGIASRRCSRRGLRRQVERARDERVFGEPRRLRASARCGRRRRRRRGRSSRSARRSRSSTAARPHPRPRGGATARRSPAWCRRRCRASGR